MNVWCSNREGVLVIWILLEECQSPMDCRGMGQEQVDEAWNQSIDVSSSLESKALARAGSCWYRGDGLTSYIHNVRMKDNVPSEAGIDYQG